MTADADSNSNYPASAHDYAAKARQKNEFDSQPSFARIPPNCDGDGRQTGEARRFAQQGCHRDHSRWSAARPLVKVISSIRWATRGWLVRFHKRAERRELAWRSGVLVDVCWAIPTWNGLTLKRKSPPLSGEEAWLQGQEPQLRILKYTSYVRRQKVRRC